MIIDAARSFRVKQLKCFSYFLLLVLGEFWPGSLRPLQDAIKSHLATHELIKSDCTLRRASLDTPNELPVLELGPPLPALESDNDDDISSSARMPTCGLFVHHLLG
jgi:hypothetical protein